MKINLLNANLIKTGIETNLINKVSLHIFDSIDSTNLFLKNLTLTNKIEICLAETQTKGRGRFGKHWHSPYAENIYFSARWQLNAELNTLTTLSIITGITIIKTLDALNITQGIKIKWPNDIYWQNKKLAGILIESLHKDNKLFIIIGIGINVNSTEITNLTNPWCSLAEITNQYWDRNIIISNLINQLGTNIKQLMQNGFAEFSQFWQKYDYLYDKQITITQGKNIISGVAKGINKHGQLKLIKNTNQKIIINSGEASIALHN